MSKLRFRVVETAFKKKSRRSSRPGRTSSVGIFRKERIQPGEDVQISS